MLWLRSMFAAAFVSCLLFMFVSATPIVLYLQQQEPNDLASLADYRMVASPVDRSSLVPQARYFGDYYPKYVISPGSELSATKRNIAIGRGDGFRPGK